MLEGVLGDPPRTETSGEFEEMIMAAGESAGLVKEIKPAGEIIDQMMNEAQRIIVGHCSFIPGRT